MSGPGDKSGVSDIQDKFGVDGYTVSSNDYGGQHHTVFDSDGGSYRFSWDTDSKGEYVDGNAHISEQ